MAYVGQLMNPWDVPARQAVEKMQLIWNGTGGVKYNITTSTTVYQKVRVRFGLNHKPNIYV